MLDFLSALSYLGHIAAGKIHPAACYKAKRDTSPSHFSKRKHEDAKASMDTPFAYAQGTQHQKRPKLTETSSAAATVAHIVTNRGQPALCNYNFPGFSGYRRNSRDDTVSFLAIQAHCKMVFSSLQSEMKITKCLLLCLLHLLVLYFRSAEICLVGHPCLQYAACERHACRAGLA